MGTHYRTREIEILCCKGDVNDDFIDYYYYLHYYYYLKSDDKLMGHGLWNPLT